MLNILQKKKHGDICEFIDSIWEPEFVGTTNTTFTKLHWRTLYIHRHPIQANRWDDCQCRSIINMYVT